MPKRSFVNGTTLTLAIWSALTCAAGAAQAPGPLIGNPVPHRRLFRRLCRMIISCTSTWSPTPTRSAGSILGASIV